MSWCKFLADIQLGPTLQAQRQPGEESLDCSHSKNSQLTTWDDLHLSSRLMRLSVRLNHAVTWVWFRTTVADDCGNAVNDWRMLWRGEWWGGKADMGENLLLTASSSKSKEEGKKKEIKGKEGERNSSFQHDNKRHDREKGAEKLLLQSPPSKPSRRQAAAVVMFLCLTFFAIHSFLLNPMFLKTIIFKMSERRKNCTVICNKLKWAAGRPFSPLEDVANSAWLWDSCGTNQEKWQGVILYWWKSSVAESKGKCHSDFKKFDSDHRFLLHIGLTPSPQLSTL